MCRDWKQRELCPRGQTCAFAHGKLEVLLFTLEKDKEFDIAEFISELRLQYTNTNTYLKQVNIIHNYDIICYFLILLCYYIAINC